VNDTVYLDEGNGSRSSAAIQTSSAAKRAGRELPVQSAR
jgi:hypothetical protein